MPGVEMLRNRAVTGQTGQDFPTDDSAGGGGLGFVHQIREYHAELDGGSRFAGGVHGSGVDIWAWSVVPSNGIGYALLVGLGIWMGRRLKRSR
jgi:hypothetical protein